MTLSSSLRPPKIGRIVMYRTDGRNGLNYDLPAIITVTQDTHPGDYPDGSLNPLPVPESPEHVHLTVFSPGGFGTQLVTPTQSFVLPQDDRDFKEALGFAPGSGTYVEHNVPFSSSAEPRSWRWPVIG